MADAPVPVGGCDLGLSARVRFTGGWQALNGRPRRCAGCDGWVEHRLGRRTIRETADRGVHQGGNAHWHIPLTGWLTWKGWNRP